MTKVQLHAGVHCCLCPFAGRTMTLAPVNLQAGACQTPATWTVHGGRHQKIARQKTKGGKEKVRPARSEAMQQRTGVQTTEEDQVSKEKKVQIRVEGQEKEG